MRDNESRQWRRELAPALLLLVWGTWENSSTLYCYGECGAVKGAVVLGVVQSADMWVCHM